MKGLASISSLPPFSCTCYWPKSQRFLQVRSQSFKDEGSSSNMVDANLGVLRARMEQVMKNERLEYTTPRTMNNIGWNRGDYETQDKNGNDATLMLEVVGLVGGSIGLVFLFGSLMIYFVAVLVHLGL
ncbi:hypothetical protein QVD17_31871 [Tagetes erecta]|uniref:Uncharacterized protein n=1 Tax=Tagetes erecta TaxID=13708 RepID=A0AAD8K515_TARER|nr:hypothetical protein QVD17_31871 [Tagetes erecta]